MTMTMTSETPDSPEAAAPADTPPPPCNLLPALLDDPKPETEDWQAQTGRAVSMVAVGFLKGERINDHHLTLAKKSAARGTP